MICNKIWQSIPESKVGMFRYIEINLSHGNVSWWYGTSARAAISYNVLVPIADQNISRSTWHKWVLSQSSLWNLHSFDNHSLSSYLIRILIQ